MATPVHGNSKIDTSYIEAERGLMKFISFHGLRNLSYEVLQIAFNRFYSIIMEMEPFVYEKFVQSEYRRKDLLTMSSAETIKKYGFLVARAVYRHAKPHQLPKELDLRVFAFDR